MIKIGTPADVGHRSAFYALGLALAVALLSPFTRLLRLTLVDPLPTFRVTTGADSGPGSLRAAIFDADRAQGRVRILVTVPEVTLATALPPLVNPSGIVVESGPRSAQINGRAVAGALLDVAAPGSVVTSLRMVGGRVGVIVRAPTTMLRNVTVTGADVGVFVGAKAADVRVDHCVFAANRIGLQISGSTGLTSALSNRFERHRAAAVWGAVDDGPKTAQLALTGNLFREDTRGVVVIGLKAAIERNTFERTDGDAVHATAARVLVTGNTIHAGLGFGIYLERLDSGRIARNDIANNCAGGIMARDVANAQIEANQIYQNGHGVVLMEGSAVRPNEVADNLVTDHFGDGVILIGASAIISSNRILRNRLTGLHVSSLAGERGRVRRSTLHLEQNVVVGNGFEELYDTYRSQLEASGRDVAAADCGWRRGVVGVIASAGEPR